MYLSILKPIELFLIKKAQTELLECERQKLIEQFRKQRSQLQAIEQKLAKLQLQQQQDEEINDEEEAEEVEDEMNTNNKTIMKDSQEINEATIIEQTSSNIKVEVTMEQQQQTANKPTDSPSPASSSVSLTSTTSNSLDLPNQATTAATNSQTTQQQQQATNNQFMNILGGLARYHLSPSHATATTNTASFLTANQYHQYHHQTPTSPATTARYHTTTAANSMFNAASPMHHPSTHIQHNLTVQSPVINSYTIKSKLFFTNFC
jgi:hypothetical protein